ncbi:MAG: ABC transporter permease [Stellaceae bacterium]
MHFATAWRGVRPPPRALVAAAAVPGLLVAVPIALTFADAFHTGFARMAGLLDRPLVGELLVNTVLLTAAAVIIGTAVGTGAAVLIERTDLPGRRVFSTLAAAPLAVPAFVASYAWVSLSPAFEGFAGALLVTACTYFPLAYLPVAAALRGLDPALEEAARLLGEPPLGVLRRVMLPQLRPAILGGAVLIALNALIEFGAFALMRFRTFTTEIYAAYQTGFGEGEAAALALVLLLFCFACLGAEAALRRRRSYARVGRGSRRPAVPCRLGAWRVPACTALSAVTVLALGVPLGMILYWLTRHGAAAITPDEVSVRAILDATAMTIGLGIGGAALTLLLALPLAILSVRWPGGALAGMLERGAWLAQGVPGIVIALALISATVRALPFLYQSTLLLLLAYAVLFMPYALVSIRAALVQAERRLEEAGRSLGLGWFGVLLRVTLPLAMPGLGAAAALVFIAVTTELPATLLLAPIGTETLAIRIWADTNTVAFAAAAPYAAILVALSLSASFVLARRFGLGLTPPDPPGSRGRG